MENFEKNDDFSQWKNVFLLVLLRFLMIFGIGSGDQSERKEENGENYGIERIIEFFEIFLRVYLYNLIFFLYFLSLNYIKFSNLKNYQKIVFLIFSII